MADLAARRLPEGARLLRRTQDFTAATVPAGLLADHSTRAGVWGRITVTSGRLRFTDAATGKERLLGVDEAQVVPPQSVHAVALEDDTVFHVAFYREAEA